MFDHSIPSCLRITMISSSFEVTLFQIFDPQKSTRWLDNLVERQGQGACFVLIIAMATNYGVSGSPSSSEGWDLTESNICFISPTISLGILRLLEFLTVCMLGFCVSAARISLR